MPAPVSNKRVKGISVYRPFVYGSIATPLPPIGSAQRPTGIPEDHTHEWTVYVRGVDGADITHWLKKVQFKLHETYSQSQRTIEAPEKFEVTETGWGEFEVTMKLFFVPEAGEKAQSLYHFLKLHPYGPDAQAQKERGDQIISQQYTEAVFTEPSEAFYQILTTDAPESKGKAAAKRSKQAKVGKRTAEIPDVSTPGSPYSSQAEQQELDLLNEAMKKVEEMRSKELDRLAKLTAEHKDLKEEASKAVKAQ